MRRGRRHPQQRFPSGLAEVELFAFWEADLAGDGTEPRGTDPPRPQAVPVPSTAPLWWALGFLAVVLLVVVLGGAS
jgi:hypothetical protein